MWNMYFSICNINMVVKLNKKQSSEYSNRSCYQYSNISKINVYLNYIKPMIQVETKVVKNIISQIEAIPKIKFQSS